MTTLRIAITALLFGAFGWLNFYANQISTLELGKAAGKQFEASDASYVLAGNQMYFWEQFSISGLFLVVAMLVIWWGPIRKAFTGMALVAALAVGATALVPTDKAYAYYSQHDYAEPYTIMPNESAFWVPDVGDNKSSQDAFDSAAYLDKNKIAAKRFLIPHQTLRGSSWGFWGDYYVPTGRLFIVDRSPVSREWLADPKKGTSTVNEGFDCQSSEGHNITVGVAISTKVREQDAAKFLYNFGVHPPGSDAQRTDPNIVFTSVFYGRSLAEVMDEKVRSNVGILVCESLMQHTLVDDSANAKSIMDDIRKQMTAYLSDRGITLDSMGWADTWSFDKEVQDSLNRHFAALQEQDIAVRLQPYVATLQGLSMADVMRKWNGVTPSSVSLTLLPQGLSDIFGQFAKNATAAAHPAAPVPTTK